MRNPLRLTWWILILACLELSTLILDRSHHLFWGRGGLFLLKCSYFGFSVVLLVRFLSFRKRKTFESMVHSYHSLSGQAWTQPSSFGSDWRKLLVYMALAVVSLANVATPLAWGDAAFRTSIVLDFLFWLMALRWVVHAHWLQALGRKEKLKEGLDDARSRQRIPMTPGPAQAAHGPAASRRPFLVGFLLMFAATSALSAWRWNTADRVYHHAALQGCLLHCLDRALDRFHREGRLDEGIRKEPCLSRYGEKIEIGIGFQRGELLLWTIERPGQDYFGNGKPGDQGMLVDAEGRFRSSGSRLR